jgi:enamine deaminase RidA (YjgF/YER057c/UK114 family)
VGVAAHSVRAVPADWLREIAAYAESHGLVRHVHAHEQPRELEECRAEHGCSPIELLHRTGFLSDRTTVVHAIHVDDHDVALLADAGAIVATCPTTEGNLGDGHFPALRYRDAGVRIAIGSDSNAVVDPFEELRELETGARRERLTRHALLAEAGDLWGAIAANGRASLGLDDAGEIEIDLDHPRLRGERRDDLARALVMSGSADTVRPVRRLISSGSDFERDIGYSRAVVDGDWVHVSGTTGFDYATMSISGDVVEQAEQALANVGAALAEAGCTFADVVRVRYLLPDAADFEACWPALRRAFGDVRPAATMQECGLTDPRMRFEIEVTARRR